MSEFAEYQERLDMREQLARIDRTLAENRKFAAETQKLTAEQGKLSAEQLKLAAVQLKFSSEQILAAETNNLRLIRFVTPLAVLVGAAASLIAAAPVLLRLLHGHT